MINTPTIRELCESGNMARFVQYRYGILYYAVLVNGVAFEFPIPVKDVEGATLCAEEKPLFLMRWMKQHIEVLKYQQNTSSADESNRRVPRYA